MAVLESQGETIGIEYVLVGATALVNELTVATRNTTHFVRIDGLVVENWWTS